MIAASTDGARIVASEGWYALPTAVDGTVHEATQEWTELLAERRAAAAPVDPPRLKRALSRGVPVNLRAEVWLEFSGAAARLRAHPDVYETLCSRIAADRAARTPPASPAKPAAGGGSSSSAGGEGGPPSPPASPAKPLSHAQRVLEQVEKDLRRTDIGSEPERLAGMRRVLCAYAAFNPDVGYVQGMNFIVVALLGVLTEPEAFWMLVLVVQDWLPEHFAKAMVGNHIDCRVLSRLTTEHLPRLAAHLRKLDVTVQLLTTRWFLCLWSSVVPTAALHRLWDLLFTAGPPSTMQVALACMQLTEDWIVSAADIGAALAGAKEALRTAEGGEKLLDLALYSAVTPRSRWTSHLGEAHARRRTDD